MNRFLLADGVLRADLDGEQVLLNPATGVYHLVNETGSELLAAFSAGATLTEGIETLASRFHVTEAAVRPDAESFLHALLERGLLVPGDDDA